MGTLAISAAESDENSAAGHLVEGWCPRQATTHENLCNCRNLQILLVTLAISAAEVRQRPRSLRASLQTSDIAPDRSGRAPRRPTAAQIASSESPDAR